MIVSIHQPDYLPWLGFFDKICLCDVFVLLDNVQFSKNYFTNRNKIRTSQGWTWLTVPVLSKGKSEQRIDEVKINNISEKKWAEKQWKTIEQNYKKAPFFSEHADFFYRLYSKEWDSLTELNKTIIYYLVDAFELKTRICEVAEIKAEGNGTELLFNICQALGANTYLSGAFGKEYLDEDLFSNHGIKVIYQEFSHPEYKQVFEPFIPNMSAIDLILNYGDDSLQILRQKVQ
ncbi:MAG: WbqC family protein [bacterium]|nr:WbqC family protein [bacterium]